MSVRNPRKGFFVRWDLDSKEAWAGKQEGPVNICFTQRLIIIFWLLDNDGVLIDICFSRVACHVIYLNATTLGDLVFLDNTCLWSAS